MNTLERIDARISYDARKALERVLDNGIDNPFSTAELRIGVGASKVLANLKIAKKIKHPGKWELTDLGYKFVKNYIDSSSRR